MQSTTRKEQQEYQLVFTSTSIYDIIAAESLVIGILQLSHSLHSEVKLWVIQLLTCSIFRWLHFSPAAPMRKIT